eukprot:CAMPEP_0179445442 /NCGR_PEP_ID=MMETSP0799-20121207/28871_1 /TAXON_ID=46947 /ORGANISM="Geminigera cryophila, Strain CCMP2564" /LENGTH=213 /DNA_ID=CAMNT_0021233455 /DNA_START=100 /DNA_END=741 /DNA_ORIENTATION=+
MAPLAMSPRPMSPGGTMRPLSPSMFPMMQHPMMAPGGAAGVGITFEPDLTYGSATHGMHVITKIRPDSPAHKSCRVQVGDILAMIQQAGETRSVPVAGLPIPRVLSMLTGQAGSGVKLHILDGKFPYLPPKLVVCAREMLPTGITQTHSTGPSYSSAYPMLAAGSSFPMLAAGSAMPMGMGSAMPISSRSVAPMAAPAMSPVPVYAHGSGDHR